jgi:hypothetical protein
MRGDVYVWCDEECWHIWADYEDHAEDAVWAGDENNRRKHPRGVAVPIAQFDEMCRRYVARYPNAKDAGIE